MALALARSDRPDNVQRVTLLVDGILRQQREEGSCKIVFNAVPDSGEELYPAEAMLALLEAHRLTGDARYLDSVVIESGFYDRVTRRPERQGGVEVACGLEGLADAYAVAVSSQDRRTAEFRRCIGIALDFLVRAQRTTGCTARERGGFGGSLTSREQRIDVTGDVASGFIKSVENGIMEPGSE
jgi:hypothetical protein